ncbi:MAG: M4 family metallopeptidase [Candidatus Omnitrophota bacterium]
MKKKIEFRKKIRFAEVFIPLFVKGVADRRFAGVFLTVFLLSVTNAFAFRAPDKALLPAEAQKNTGSSEISPLPNPSPPGAGSLSIGLERGEDSGGGVVTPSQQAALSSYPKLKVNWGGNGVPNSLRGFDQPVSGEPASASLNFLEGIKNIYRMKNPGQEFKLHKEILPDRTGYLHVRLDQYYQGLPVVGSQLIVHINDKSSIYQVNGRYTPDIAVSIIPGITETQALGVGYKHLTGKINLEIIQQPQLVIFPIGNQPHLAYHYVLSYNNGAGDLGKWVYYVDANTGKVLRSYNDLKYVAPPTAGGVPGAIKGSRLTGEDDTDTEVTILGWHETADADIWYLYDQSAVDTGPWYIYNLSTDSSVYTDTSTYAYRTATNDWGTTDRTEISAGNNFSAIQGYFNTVYGRKSYDDLKACAKVNVHDASVGANAYWDSELQEFSFGDGDGVDVGPLTVLDLMGHEYAHAWTDNASQLIYVDETGALNESFSDIIGVSVEFAAQPDGQAVYPDKTAGSADWLIGEDASLSSPGFRDMRNPSNTETVGSGNEQPSRYHGQYWLNSGTNFLLDNGGIHYNNAPQNFVYYLLSEGGTGTNDGLPYDVTGIGETNVRQIAYKANNDEAGSSTAYQQMRDCWVNAADDLDSTGVWGDSVGAAWDAIGIIDVPASPLEDFEGTSFSSGWSTGGDVAWSISNTDAVLGSQSAQAGDIDDSQSTWLQWSGYLTDADVFSFFIKVSSEWGYDYVKFYVDDVEQTEWCGGYVGDIDWTSYCIWLNAGSHTLKWEYIKDADGSSVSDTVWLDAVSFSSPGTTLYTIAATAGDGGSISPSGAVLVPADATSTFAITPSSGYHIEDILVDDSSVDTATSYTFTEVSSDHTISVTFDNDTSQSDEDVLPSGYCFIATAAFGTPLAKEVEILRQFRERFLMQRDWGRRFIRFYNRHSPPVAEFIRPRPLWCAFARGLLRPLIWTIKGVILSDSEESER